MQKKDIKQRIREYFFVHPTARLRVRQIEREVHVPLPSAIRYAKELEKEGVVKGEMIGGVRLYSADMTSPAYCREKRLHNIRQLYASGFVDHLVKRYFNPTVVLFGSYATGEDIETSDIDVVVFTTAQIDIEEIRIYERTLKREIQLFQYKRIEDVRNVNVANSIVNGIILNGFIEVFHERGNVGTMQAVKIGSTPGSQ